MSSPNTAPVRVENGVRPGGGVRGRRAAGALVRRPLLLSHGGRSRAHALHTYYSVHARHPPRGR